MKDARIRLTIITLALICVGIIMIFSASCVNAQEQFHDSYYYLKRHMFFLAIGLVASFWIMNLDYRSIQPNARILLGISLFLLALVLIPHLGKESYGARRWFKIGIFHFQPSELAKLAVIIYTADFLSRKQDRRSCHQILGHHLLNRSKAVAKFRHQHLRETLDRT